MKIHPYLNFDGQCAEAFSFYARVLGGSVRVMSVDESPMGADLGPEWQGRTIHAHLDLGDQVLLGSDSPPGQHRQPQGVWVSVQVRTSEETERIFNALADGGTPVMALQETFWSKRFGMLVDRFGTPWMLNCDPNA